MTAGDRRAMQAIHIANKSQPIRDDEGVSDRIYVKFSLCRLALKWITCSPANRQSNSSISADCHLFINKMQKKTRTNCDAER